MEISKKELLKTTGISYGQLYRWKREGLIPEEWFVKRSSPTGQETFFPQDKILKRIHAIQQLKDSYSLEELANILTPEVSNRLFSEEVWSISMSWMSMWLRILWMREQGQLCFPGGAGHDCLIPGDV